MASDSLPLYSGTVDHLRYGFHSLETQHLQTHPVAQLQRCHDEIQWSNKMDMIRRTYGSHMAMRLATEKAILSRQRRLPGLQSSTIGLDTLTGNDLTIGFEDFLNGKFRIIYKNHCFLKDKWVK